jgi:hypothetical protein
VSDVLLESQPLSIEIWCVDGLGPADLRIIYTSVCEQIIYHERLAIIEDLKHKY